MKTLRSLAACIAAAALIPLAAHAQDVVQPLRYGSSVDLDSGVATFYVQFNRAPDLYTVDEYFRQADSFQYWVDSEAPNPIQRAYDGMAGRIPVGTQSVISASEIPVLDAMEVIWVMPDDWPGPRSRGGWGEVKGHVPYALVDTTLSFTVPLSLLQDDDGLFYYTFETFRYGGWGEADYHGISGVDYVVAIPEPAALGMLTAGLFVLAAARRRRR